MINPVSIKKILWLRADAIGDALLASSMLPHIKNYFHIASITVVCQQHLVELYQASSLIEHIIAIDKARFIFDECYREDILKQLRLMNFDLVLDSVYSRERALECLTTEIGVPLVVAHEKDNTVKPELNRHKEFLAKLGILVDCLEPMVWTTAEDEAFADAFFKQHALEPSKTYALFAGALSMHRYYEYYGLALDHALQGSDYTVMALGGTRDVIINQQNLKNISGRVIDMTGMTTLRQTAALLRRCRLGLGAETGLAHMACAVGLSHVIALGGGHFGRFMPYSPLTSAVILPLACYGCDWRCRYKKAYCVQAIDPMTISFAIKESLEKKSAQTRLFISPRMRYHRSWFGPLWKEVDEVRHYRVVQQQ